ncbi:MAG TPA: hypothetical protein ENN13_05265 [Candidatus Altiarchaeales archaeon]|nr:hypothetical protein [Candidatus Altiarchaeales archaeon]
MGYDKSFTVMDRLPGYTLSELTYKRPEILEEHKIDIAFQLGMHTVFSYVFGVRDGYQTNYIYDPVSRLLTRIDKERFLEVPDSPRKTLEDNDAYTQEIASCELSNLKYVPSFRTGEERGVVVKALESGFMEKYREVKVKKQELLELVRQTRNTWFELNPRFDKSLYGSETEIIVGTVSYLIDQDALLVWKRLVKAKIEVDRK